MTFFIFRRFMDILGFWYEQWPAWYSPFPIRIIWKWELLSYLNSNNSSLDMCPMAQVMLWTSHGSEHVVVRGRLLWWRWWWRVTTPLLWLPRFPSIPSRRLDAGFAAIRHWIHLTLLCNIAKGKIISTLKGETCSVNRPLKNFGRKAPRILSVVCR